MPFPKEKQPQSRFDLFAVLFFYSSVILSFFIVVVGDVVYQNYHNSSKEIKILLQPQTNLNPNVGKPNHYSQVEREIEEKIYSDGELLPLNYDLIADRYEKIIILDEIIACEHKPTKLYLWRIVKYLKTESKIWGEKKTTLVLYDDRYAGIKRNALSLPAGTMFIGASLVLAAQSEAELAGLLSHERSHAILRHRALTRKVIKNVTFLEHKFIKNGEVEKQSALSSLKLKIFGFGGVLGELGKTFEFQTDVLAQEILRRSNYNDFAPRDFLLRFANLYFANDPVGLAAMKGRMEEMLKDANVFKSATGYAGKNFIISNAEEFKLMQKNLFEYLQKQ